MPVATDLLLGLSMRFHVTIDKAPYDLGSWSKASGLEVTWALVEHRAGDSGNDRWYYPGVPKYPYVKLERAAEKAGTESVRTWLNRNSFSYEATSGKVELFDAHQEAVTSWNLEHIIPIKWSITPFESNSQKVALETLELAHMGFLDDEKKA